jgi:hypothetical protein
MHEHSSGNAVGQDADVKVAGLDGRMLERPLNQNKSESTSASETANATAFADEGVNVEDIDVTASLNETSTTANVPSSSTSFTAQDRAISIAASSLERTESYPSSYQSTQSTQSSMLAVSVFNQLQSLPQRLTLMYDLAFSLTEPTDYCALRQCSDIILQLVRRAGSVFGMNIFNALLHCFKPADNLSGETATGYSSKTLELASKYAKEKWTVALAVKKGKVKTGKNSKNITFNATADVKVNPIQSQASAAAAALAFAVSDFVAVQWVCSSTLTQAVNPLMFMSLNALLETASAASAASTATAAASKKSGIAASKNKGKSTVPSVASAAVTIASSSVVSSFKLPSCVVQLAPKSPESMAQCVMHLSSLSARAFSVYQHVLDSNLTPDRDTFESVLHCLLYHCTLSNEVMLQAHASASEHEQSPLQTTVPLRVLRDRSAMPESIKHTIRRRIVHNQVLMYQVFRCMKAHNVPVTTSLFEHITSRIINPGRPWIAIKMLGKTLLMQHVR